MYERTARWLCGKQRHTGGDGRAVVPEGVAQKQCRRGWCHCHADKNIVLERIVSWA